MDERLNDIPCDCKLAAARFFWMPEMHRGRKGRSGVGAVNSFKEFLRATLSILPLY